MSFLSVKLAELMRNTGLKTSDLARSSGIDDSRISRWLTDKQLHITPADLENLCAVLCPTKRDKADLLRAHLLDSCVGPGADLIQIQITGSDHLPIQDSRQIPLAPDLEEAFAILRANIQDRELQKILISLAELFRTDPAINSKRAEDVAMLPDEVLRLTDEATSPIAGKSTPGAIAPGAREKKVDYKKRSPSRK